MQAAPSQNGLAYCPSCQTALAAPLAYAGRPVNCKTCGSRFTLPDQQDLFESAVAYLIDHDGDREADEQPAFAAPPESNPEAGVYGLEPSAHQDTAWVD